MILMLEQHCLMVNDLVEHLQNYLMKHLKQEYLDKQFLDKQFTQLFQF